MILKLLCISLCAVLVNSELYEGDLCQFDDGRSGQCSTLQKCPSVYQQAISGQGIGKLCSYAGYTPIVCCPSSMPSTTPLPATTPRPIGDGRGEIAKRKCAEYAKYVYTLEYPPILISGSKPSNVSQCAIKNIKLIVGGEKAELKEFPHMAAVGFNRKDAGITWLCGGTLISEKFVMTAAHCRFSLDYGAAAWVRVGDLNLVSTMDHSRPQDRRIKRSIKHPDYKKPSEYHDIALLELESPVEFTAFVRPACLHTWPTTGTDNAIATGWGKVDWSDEEGNNDLLKVTLPLVSQRDCNASYSTAKIENGVIDDWMICAGARNKDTCQGDSGGPLVIYNTVQYCMYDVVGVTSLGQLCGYITAGIYTRVYHYLPWIESIVWPQG